MEFITINYELTHRLVSMIKNTTEKTQLNECWVFTALLVAGYNRQPGLIFDITTGRATPDSLSCYSSYISKELHDRVKHVARIANLNKYNGDLDIDEAAARLLVLAFTDRDCEFGALLNQDDVDRLYLLNPELGLKH